MGLFQIGKSGGSIFGEIFKRKQFGKSTKELIIAENELERLNSPVFVQAEHAEQFEEVNQYLDDMIQVHADFYKGYLKEQDQLFDTATTLKDGVTQEDINKLQSSVEYFEGVKPTLSSILEVGRFEVDRSIDLKDEYIQIKKLEKIRDDAYYNPHRR